MEKQELENETIKIDELNSSQKQYNVNQPIIQMDNLAGHFKLKLVKLTLNPLGVKGRLKCPNALSDNFCDPNFRSCIFNPQNQNLRLFGNKQYSTNSRRLLCAMLRLVYGKFSNKHLNNQLSAHELNQLIALSNAEGVSPWQYSLNLFEDVCIKAEALALRQVNVNNYLKTVFSIYNKELYFEEADEGYPAHHVQRKITEYLEKNFNSALVTHGKLAGADCYAQWKLPYGSLTKGLQSVLSKSQKVLIKLYKKGSATRIEVRIIGSKNIDHQLILAEGTKRAQNPNYVQRVSFIPEHIAQARLELSEAESLLKAIHQSLTKVTKNTTQKGRVLKGIQGLSPIWGNTNSAIEMAKILSCKGYITNEEVKSHKWKNQMLTFSDPQNGFLDKVLNQTGRIQSYQLNKSRLEGLITAPKTPRKRRVSVVIVKSAGGGAIDMNGNPAICLFREKSKLQQTIKKNVRKLIELRTKIKNL